MATNNGAWTDFDNLNPVRIFHGYRGDTKKVTVKQGQVLKARSFLETDSDGKAVAFSGFTETALVTFAAITNTQTLILGGITFTAGSAGATAAQLATIWSMIVVGDTNTTANAKLTAAGIASTVGTFTAGTFAGWETEKYSDTKVIFRSTAPGTNATDLADTGTATDPTITIIAGETNLLKPVYVLAFDVDATSADVDASAYINGDFYADALVWAVDPAVDTITASDGTTVACTSYNTGCYGTSDASNLMKHKLVEGTAFSNIMILKAGEVR